MDRDVDRMIEVSGRIREVIEATPMPPDLGRSIDLVLQEAGGTGRDAGRGLRGQFERGRQHARPDGELSERAGERRRSSST